MVRGRKGNHAVRVRVAGAGAVIVAVALGGCGVTSGSREGAGETSGSGEAARAERPEARPESARAGRPEGLPEGAVLAWRVSQGLWGREALIVAGDGTASYEFEPVAGSSDAPASGTAQLSPSDLAAARDALRDAEVCGLDHDRPGVPDEAMTQLAIDMGEDLRCEVEVWDDDWRERAPEVQALVMDWIRRARG